MSHSDSMCIGFIVFALFASVQGLVAREKETQHQTGLERIRRQSEKNEKQLDVKFLNSEEFTIHIYDIIQSYEIRNAECVIEKGKFWFWYDGPECQFCGKVCPSGTNTSRCIIHCTGYWEELQRNATNKEIESRFKKTDEEVTIYKGLTITFIVLVFLLFMIIFWLFYKQNKDMKMNYQLKQQTATSDKIGQHHQATCNHDGEPNATHPHTVVVIKHSRQESDRLVSCQRDSGCEL